MKFRGRKRAVAPLLVASIVAPVTPLFTAPPKTSGPWVIINGRGYGHGVGMAQDGAYWMGKQGRTASEILRTFYPGTSLGNRGGSIRVPLGGGGAVRIDLPTGGSVGGVDVPAGSSIAARPDGGSIVASFSTPSRPKKSDGAEAAPAMQLIAFRTQAVESSTVPPVPVASPVTAAPSIALIPAETTTEVATTISASVSPISVPPSPSPEPVTSAAPPPVSTSPTAPSSEVPTTSPEAANAPTPDNTVRGAPLVIRPRGGSTFVYGGRPYRGAAELSSRGGVRVVNEVDVEQYLRGMGEVTDPRWPAAALQTQAIAARTYAFRTMASAGEVCPTQRCQVYFGAKAEYGAMDKAVEATRGKVVTYGKDKLAITFYSASGGGTIATPEEAFGGTNDLPYLKAGTYPTGDVKAWVVTLPITELGRRVGYRGAASGVEITKVGPSGRALEVTVTGSGSPLTIAGPRFDAALGLRSTFFTLHQQQTREVDPSAGEVFALAPVDQASGANVDGGPGATIDGLITTDNTPVIFDQSALLSEETIPVDTIAPTDSTVVSTPTTVVAPASIAAKTRVPGTPKRPTNRPTNRPTKPPRDVNEPIDALLLGALIIGFVSLAACIRFMRRQRNRD